MSSSPLGDSAHILKQAAEVGRVVREAQEAAKAIQAERITIPNLPEVEHLRRSLTPDLALAAEFANGPFGQAVRNMNHLSKTIAAVARTMPENQKPNEKPSPKPVAETGPRRYLKTEPEHFRLERDDARDLAFVGWKLGSGYVGSGKYDPADGGRWERSTEVTLYVTKGNDYVVHESRTRDFDVAAGDKVTVIRQNYDPAGDFDRAVMGKEPLADRSAEARLLESLRMGSATRDAWNEACKNYPPLRPFEVETLE